MDIRNFFTAKKPTNKKKVAAEEAVRPTDKDKKNKSNDRSKKNSSSSNSNSSNADAKPSSNKPSVKQEENHDKKDKDTSIKKRKIIIDSEEEEEVDVGDFFAAQAKSKPPKREPPVPATSESPAKKPKPSPKVRKEEGTKVKRENPKKKSPKKKRIREDFDSESSEDDDFQPKRDKDYDDDDDYDDEEEDDFKPSPAKSKPSPAKTSPVTSKKSPAKIKSPAKKARKSPSSASKSSSETKETIEVLEPSLERDSFDEDSVQVPEFMAGLTFVFTGIMEGLGRDDASDLVKTLGGRVTGQVSGKTSYLVIGELLEDGRSYEEGSKYRKATTELKDKIKLVMGAKKFYGLCHMYHEKAMKEKGIEPAKIEVKKKEIPSRLEPASAPAAAPSNPYAKVSINPYKKNPYAKAGSNSDTKPAAVASNPYAKTGIGSAKPVAIVSNPYGKQKNPYGKPETSSSSAAAKDLPTSQRSSMNNDLWVDRYKPTHTRDILGNKSHIVKLQNWLKTWERTWLHTKSGKKSFTNPKGPWKAALLSGPPGIGKTTSATLVSKEDGREVMEFNASDARSKKTLQNVLGELTESHGISFINSDGKKPQKAQNRVVIMDEVDGMGAGDRSGMAELIQMIKRSKVPIICICNDRQSQKIKSLLPYCMDLRFSRPQKHILANRAIKIAEMEHLQVERNAAEAIAESCGNDVRQVLNLLQMWAQKKDGSDSTLTYRNLRDREKSINKDEMLRVSLFDASKLIMEGRTGLSEASDKANVDSFMKRNDAFFVDYGLTGLLVQQNYPKIVNGQYLKLKREQDPVAEQELLERFHKAAESISDYNLVENQIRGGDGNWSLLPTAAMLTVKCGYHAGGENGGFLPGFPEFSAWMGKNSTTGKNFRLLNELNHHMNYKVSANSLELRQTYLPILRERILGLLKKSDKESVTEAIALMDDYGLNREDISEKLDVFVLGKKPESYDDLDSSQKAAFTREYNAGRHMQQALVHEQGGGPVKSKKNGAKEKDPGDLDAIDEDDFDDDEESDVDEEKELKKFQETFKRKKPRGKGGASKKGATKKPTKGKKK